jgi:hypothetical protein
MPISMRTAIAVVLVFLGAVMAQGSEETKTSEPEAQPMLRESIQLNRMWSFHFEGKKRNGDFLELAQPDGRTLVITHLEIRMRQTMRLAVVEHKSVTVKGKQTWKKKLRRSELFSIGHLDGSTKYSISQYKSDLGMRFGEDMRPSLEITQGGGDMAVYAEGYWVD